MIVARLITINRPGELTDLQFKDCRYTLDGKLLSVLHEGITHVLPIHIITSIQIKH